MPTETTALSPLEEALFQRWAQQQKITDVDHPDSHYDYRGLYQSKAPHTPGAHFPDTYKQHGHPTFSQESAYSKGPADGGMWVGESFVPQPKLAIAHQPEGLAATLMNKLVGVEGYGQSMWKKAVLGLQELDGRGIMNDAKQTMPMDLNHLPVDPLKTLPIIK